MSSVQPSRADKELWQRLALPASRSGMVGEMELASWLEGRLSEAEAERVEAAVSASPALRRGALELADLLDRPLPAAPERMVVRARALVGFETEVRHGGGFLARFLSGRARYAVQQIAMAVVALVIAGGGFVMGGGLGASYAQERHSSTPSADAKGSTTTVTNEITEFFSGDGI